MKKNKYKLNLQNFADDEEETPSEEEELSNLEKIIKTQQEQLKGAVKKEDYEKLRAENKTLTDMILGTVEMNVDKNEEPEKINLEEIEGVLFDTSKEMTNLDFVKNALKYRQGMLQQKNIDVFAPQSGAMFHPEPEDIATAEKVADVLQQCVDECDDDPGVFTAMLTRRINDDPILLRQRKRR